MSTYERVEQAAAAIRSRCTAAPQVAIVLGSGLGDFADSVVDAIVTPYEQIPHWPASKVIGHAGRLAIGTVAGTCIAALAGRVHFYEGHDLSTVVFATRVMGRLGVKQIILTNAAGGINTGFAQGALMVIDDHINLLGSNPLVGPNDERFGARFPDMSEVYSRDYQRVARETAGKLEIPLASGVYLALQGPNYETPAEIRMMSTLGADAVGMSTVPEAIVACQMGMRTLGISLITNPAAGVGTSPIDHDAVMKMGERVSQTFSTLMRSIIPNLVALD